MASTGAKFTPTNHRPTGDRWLDRICTSEMIQTSPPALAAEAASPREMGCRHYHFLVEQRKHPLGQAN